MGLTETLVKAGYTLPGQDPNIITEEGGTPHIGATGDKLTTISRSLAASQAKQKKEEEDNRKKMEDQMSMYQTLRDAGYTPGKAHAAVLKGEMPDDLPGPTGKEKKAGLEAEKTEAEIGKIKAETEVVGEKKNTVEAQILNKIARGEDLLPGEQKIYDDVIKKKNPSGLAALLGEDGGSDTPVIEDDMVPVISPEGKRGKVKRSKLEKAIESGFKKVGE